jgi:hypothetical protein
MKSAASHPILDPPVRTLLSLVPGLCDHRLRHTTARPLSGVHANANGVISFTDAPICVSQYAQLVYGHELPPLLPRPTATTTLGTMIEMMIMGSIIILERIIENIV